MKIIVIDGQGGKMGKSIIEQLKKSHPDLELIAIGTNSIATAAMLKAGADMAATGENSVEVACRKADVIMGPVGIVIADSMLGEITPRMAAAVGQSQAGRILIPVNMCDNIVVGIADLPMTKKVESAVEALADFMK